MANKSWSVLDLSNDLAVRDLKVPSFVEPYTETCQLCTQMLLDPYQTKCGHRLCRKCLTTYLRKNSDPALCPFKEEDCEEISIVKKDGSVYPDFYLVKNLKSKKVHCDFKNCGCPEIMPWSRLEAHVRECEFGRVDCPNAGLGCSARLTPTDKITHVEQCEYTPMPCTDCQESIATCLMEEHRGTCPNVEIACLHNCGQCMQRSEFPNHLVNCPNKPTECKYSKKGCYFKGSLAEVQDHEKHEQVAHLDLVTSYADRLDGRVRDLEASFEASSHIRGTTLKELEDTVRQLDRKLTRQEVILKETQKTVVKQVAKQVEKQREEVVQSEVSVAGVANSVASLQEQISVTTERCSKLQTSHARTSTMLNSLEEQLRNQSLKYQDFDMRFQMLETASYNGVLLWKISEYDKRKAEAKRVGGIQSLYSQAFYTSRHGYRMCARVYLNGDGMGLNNHLSLFFVVMKGEFDALLKWPFRQKVTLKMMDQTGRNCDIQDTFRPDPSSSSFQKPTTNMNVASGCPMFISHNVLEASDSPYLKDNTIFIKLIVDISDLSP